VIAAACVLGILAVEELKRAFKLSAFCYIPICLLLPSVVGLHGTSVSKDSFNAFYG
jgi:hypothetical protein